MIPGEVVAVGGTIELNEGRRHIELVVLNGGDRPVQVGSHFHFAETNPALLFDRDAAVGMRLAVPAGTSVRFEPGVDRTVTLVDYAGERVVAGFRGRYRGPVGRPATGSTEAPPSEPPQAERPQAEPPRTGPAGAG